MWESLKEDYKYGLSLVLLFVLLILVLIYIPDRGYTKVEYLYELEVATTYVHWYENADTLFYYKDTLLLGYRIFYHENQGMGEAPDSTTFKRMVK